MRRILIVLMLLLTAGPASAMVLRQRQRADGNGHFGAPVLKFTTVRDQGALMFGGRGGWNLTPSLTLGGGLYATVTEVDAPWQAVPDAPCPLDIKCESFG